MQIAPESMPLLSMALNTDYSLNAWLPTARKRNASSGESNGKAQKFALILSKRLARTSKPAWNKWLRAMCLGGTTTAKRMWDTSLEGASLPRNRTAGAGTREEQSLSRRRWVNNKQLCLHVNICFACGLIRQKLLLTWKIFNWLQLFTPAGQLFRKLHKWF